MLFCKDGLNQKNPYHILTEPHGPTCQEAHEWSSHGLRDSGLVFGLQKPSLKWSSLSSHHTCRCLVPFPHVTRHCRNVIDHYLFSVLISINASQNDTMINLHIKTQLKDHSQDIFLSLLQRYLLHKDQPPQPYCPNPSVHPFVLEQRYKTLE